MLNVEAAVEAMVAQVAGAESLSIEALDVDKTVLCIIDMNNGFALEGALSSPRVKDIIEITSQTAKRCLEKGMSVIAYTDHHPADAAEFSAYPAHCVEGTVECELVDSLKALEGQGLKVQKKNSTNGVLAFNPAVSGLYKDYVVTGCVTDICVYQYAVTLRAYLNEHQLPGDVYVVENQVQTFQIDGFHHGDLMHVTFLKSLMDNGVKVVKAFITD